jgi:hypothetical protein
MERLRQQALRHQISRFASSVLLDAAFRSPRPGAVAALFCDLSELARFADAGLEPEALIDFVQEARALALDALMGEGATVQVSQGEMLVGLFADEGGLGTAAHRAVRTACRMVRLLDRRVGGLAARGPGIAVTHAHLPDARAASVFFSVVGAAANLQRQAEGRILVDPEIAAALGANLSVAAGVEPTVYEVPV